MSNAEIDMIERIIGTEIQIFERDQVITAILEAYDKGFDAGNDRGYQRGIEDVREKTYPPIGRQLEPIDIGGEYDPYKLEV